MAVCYADRSRTADRPEESLRTPGNSGGYHTLSRAQNLDAKRYPKLFSRTTKNPGSNFENYTPLNQFTLDVLDVIAYDNSMKHLAKKLFGVVATVVWLFAGTIAGADSVTLVPSGDATISEYSPESRLGGRNTIESGSDGPDNRALRNRALLKFDLASSIPSNAIVTSAALTLTLYHAPRPDMLWFSLHKVLQDWSETVVTWSNRLSPPAPWSVPGGAAPLDYSSSVTQSNLIDPSSVPPIFTFTSNPAMVADVQAWVSSPTNNLGWILICEMEDLERSKRKFASSEYTINSIPTNRPSLEVQFTLPPPPLTLTLLPQMNGQFQFQFNAESNRNYTAEYCSDLITMNWMALTNITPCRLRRTSSFRTRC